MLDDGSRASVNVRSTFLNQIFATGIEGNQATRAWQLKEDTITAGSTDDIDLYDLAAQDIGCGLGRDALGQLMTHRQMVGFLLKHVSGAGYLEVMPTNPANYATWVPTMLVANGNALLAGGVVMLMQPAARALPVVDASSHMLRLGAESGDVTYSLYLLGRHYGMTD